MTVSRRGGSVCVRGGGVRAYQNLRPRFSAAAVLRLSQKYTTLSEKEGKRKEKRNSQKKIIEEINGRENLSVLGILGSALKAPDGRPPQSLHADRPCRPRPRRPPIPGRIKLMSPVRRPRLGEKGRDVTPQPCRRKKEAVKGPQFG